MQVATYLRCGGGFYSKINTGLLPSLPVKKIKSRLIFDRIVAMSLGYRLLVHPVHQFHQWTLEPVHGCAVRPRLHKAGNSTPSSRSLPADAAKHVVALLRECSRSGPDLAGGRPREQLNCGSLDGIL